MFLFRLSEEELKPHRKLVTECKKSLEKILTKTNELNKLNWFWKGKNYENTLDKAKSKIEAWEDILSHQNETFRLKVKQALKEDLDAIKNLYEQIDDSFTQKGWLKKKVERYKPMLNTMSAILRIISLVLACLGIEIGGILLFAQEAAAKLIPGDNY